MNLSINSFVKNPKVMGIVAAGLLTGAVVTGCSKKDRLETTIDRIETTNKEISKDLKNTPENETLVKLVKASRDLDLEVEKNSALENAKNDLERAAIKAYYFAKQ